MIHGGDRMGAVQAPAGQAKLLEIEQLDQPEGDQPIEQGALPAGEHIDRTRREPPRQRLAAGAAECAGRTGKGRPEAAGGQLEMAFEQGQHGAQIGRLRQPIRPAPLEGFDHRGADAGLLGQLAQPQTPTFAGLAQPAARLLEGIVGKARGAPLGSHRRPLQARPKPPHQRAEGARHGGKRSGGGGDLQGGSDGGPHSRPRAPTRETSRHWPSGRSARRSEPIASRLRSSTGYPSRAAVRRI